MLPNMVLDQILYAAELFPPEIVKKSAGRVGSDRIRNGVEMSATPVFMAT